MQHHTYTEATPTPQEKIRKKKIKGERMLNSGRGTAPYTEKIALSPQCSGFRTVEPTLEAELGESSVDLSAT